MNPPPPPMPPGMFPHAVTIVRAAYPKGVTGGPERGVATTTPTTANVQSAGMDKTMQAPAVDGMRVSSEAVYDVSFATNPTVAEDDTISWAGPLLIVQAPATFIARFGLWRVRCIART